MSNYSNDAEQTRIFCFSPCRLQLIGFFQRCVCFTSSVSKKSALNRHFLTNLRVVRNFNKLLIPSVPLLSDSFLFECPCRKIRQACFVNSISNPILVLYQNLTAFKILICTAWEQTKAKPFDIKVLISTVNLTLKFKFKFKFRQNEQIV